MALDITSTTPLTKQTVDFHNDNLQSIMLYVQLTRASTLNNQVTSDATALQNQNAVLKEANAALAAATAAKQTAEASSDDDDKKASVEPADYTNFISKYGVSKDTTGNDTIHNPDEWDVNIEYLKTFIDNLNSSSQLDMSRLQELTNKHDQAFELVTTFLQKSNQALDGIMQIK